MSARLIWKVCRGGAPALALIAVACSARAPLVVATDADVAAEAAPRVPSCQPGIRETGCTAVPADADERGSVDAGADGDAISLDAGTESLPEAGSSADASTIDGATVCQPTGGGLWGLRLVDVQPTRVTSHTTVAFMVTYEGDLPSPQTLWIRLGSAFYHLNPGSLPDSKSFKVSFPIAPPAGLRRLSILQGTDPTHLLEIAWLDCAVEVVTLPASPALVSPADDDTLGIPLHPELARYCARSGYFGLTNRGDDLVTVRSVALSGHPGFSIADDRCTNQSLAFNGDGDALCSVKVCFTDSAPGTDTGSLTFHTTAGDLEADLSSVVLPETEGLDRSFAATGARLLPPWHPFPNAAVIEGATVLNNGASIAIWDPSYVLLFVSAEGDPWLPPLGDVPSASGFTLASFTTVRAAGPGQGIYALISPFTESLPVALVHFFDDGTRDTSFAGSGMVNFDDNFILAPNGGLEIQPSGRVLVIGTLNPQIGVNAYRPNGDEDVAYRTTVSDLDPDRYRGAIRAIDNHGRLYLRTTSGVVRLKTDGGIDPGFSFTGSPDALAVGGDQRLLVAGMGTLSALDDAGAPSAIPFGAMPELAATIVGIAEDARGRILLTGSTGVVRRYEPDGTFDGVVGFAEGGARTVICPPAAGCLIVGTLYEGSVDISRPAGTTLDEDFVLRLAP